MFDTVKEMLYNTERSPNCLFIGKAYDAVFNEIYEKICYPKIIHLFSVGDRDFDLYKFIDFCIDGKKKFLGDGHTAVLRLGNRGAAYQSELLMPLDNLTLPLVVFANNDELEEAFVSRFKQVLKHPNEIVKVRKFQSFNRVLIKPSIPNPYECPYLIKLGNYSKLTPFEKKIDTFISVLSKNESVYREVLSELQPPIKKFDYDVQLEAMSLLKRRREGEQA